MIGSDKGVQSSQVVRPPVSFVGDSHSYYLDGEKLPGISTVAKVGDQDAWGIASAWGFRIGYEGAYEVMANMNHDQMGEDANWLRAQLQKRGLTPWSKRDQAGDRGTWVHDVLEGLAQRGEIPDLGTFSEEVIGHVKAVMRWYLDYRPEFVATEVQVVSEEHRFAGRYDIRATIPAVKLLPLFEDHDSDQLRRLESFPHSLSPALCLIDLKTSKRVYPTSHFAQLSGYELASVEMGFPATDAQFVLNTHPDGTYDFVPSWSSGEDFLAYLDAHNAVQRIKANDPEVRRVARQEGLLLNELPKTFAELMEDDFGLERGALIQMLKELKKRGLIEQIKGTWQKTRPLPA